MAAIMNVSNEDLRPSTMPVRAPAAMATEQDERLVRLLANGTEGQWSSNEDIDWDREPLVPGRISSSLYTEAVSQLYYGEIATVRVCRRLLDELNGPRVRLFLQTQIGDETRHAGIYGGYLERLGGLAPMDDVLAAALDRAMAWPGSYHGLIVAFHNSPRRRGVATATGPGQMVPLPPPGSDQSEDFARRGASCRFWQNTSAERNHQSGR